MAKHPRSGHRYHKGMPELAKAREKHWDDTQDEPGFQDAPGDEKAREKGMEMSKHTIAYHKKYGKTDESVDLNENATAALKKKSEKSGIAAGILRKVYSRGVAAWKTGHRPGTTPQQWGHARVSSFINKAPGTWGGADKDLASQARGSKKKTVEEGRTFSDKAEKWIVANKKRFIDRYGKDKGLDILYGKATKLFEAADHEYEMARRQLDKTESAVKRLRDILKRKSEGELQAWVQSKLTKGSDYMDTAADYMDSKANESRCWPGYKPKPGKKAYEKGSCIKEAYLDWLNEEKLGKISRTPGGPKKFMVKVKDPQTGNVKTVRFGDPNLEIKRDDPKRRKSFRARHDCANKKDRTTPGYWSCKQWRAGAKVED